MKILITGARGMLGRTLCRRLSMHELLPTDLPELDICDSRATFAALAQARPQQVIHCAAFTAVDACEEQVEAAWRVNAMGSANLAAACTRVGARLLAISTDYVFDGRLDRPYHEWDQPQPQSVYGTSKCAGEEAIRAHCPDHCILRIAWLYGAGGPSFLHTMARLGQEDGPPLRVVDDQHGNPTSCDAVANCIDQLIATGVVGTVHGTCSGETTWYGFARAILSATGSRRAITPCTSAEFPRPAPRPANSRLEQRALRLHGLPAMPDWHASLERFLADHPDL